MSKTILTTWQLRRYDVWGNAKDGYEVNDMYTTGSVELRLTVNRYNAGTPQEFETATPSNDQIRKAFGLGKIRLDIDGDDMQIEVSREHDGCPLGSMLCTSHISLSPVRKQTTLGSVK